MPKIIRVQLTPEQREELNQRARARTLAPRLRDRLEMVRLSDLGQTIPQIAQTLGQHEQTVRKYRYDPAAHRSEWLWRGVRPAVTHNHQRPTFALLRDDLRMQFQVLAANPAAVLQHIGSPGVLDTVPRLIQPLAA